MSRPHLTFLVHRGKDYTLRHYFKTWGRSVADRVTFRTYPRLGVTGSSLVKRVNRLLKGWRTGTLSLSSPPSPGSVFACTDLEILAPWEADRVASVARQLRTLPRLTLLNDPERCLTRFKLLRVLNKAGINSFGVTSAAAGVMPSRWPVFTRDDRSHDDDSISGLLETPAELQRHLDSLAAAGVDLEDRTIVEYAGKAGSDGLFRKYAAIRLGEAIVPCHIFFGRRWVVKHSIESDSRAAREELDYIETNPHEEILRRAFDLAGIEYGRIDYGVIDGRVEVWEINTNPYLIRPEYTRQRERHEALGAFSRRFNQALLDLLDG